MVLAMPFFTCMPATIRLYPMTHSVNDAISHLGEKQSPKKTCAGGERASAIRDVGPLDAIIGNQCANSANATVAGMKDNWGGVADAVRHCTWLCCMTQTIGKAQAKILGDNHEACNPIPKCKCLPNGYKSQAAWGKAEERMDAFNNNVGMRLGSDPNVDCASACTAAANSGQLRVNQPNGYHGQSGCSGSD